MRFPRRELGLALVCAGLLMMEICLTKIFSIVLWYHFGFLAVSTALLGFASSGVYLSLKQRQLVGAEADRPIAWSAAVAAVMAVVSLWLVTQTTFDVYTIVDDRTIGTLVAFVLWVTLPFFFLGLVISRTLAAFPERANVLYGADLIGSALGCFGAVAILSQDTSGQTTILLAACAVAAGGVLFAGRLSAALVGCVIALAIPAAAIGLLQVDDWFPLQSPPSKPYHQIESIDEYRRIRSQPLLRRGVVELKDGTALEIEVTDPLRFTDGGEKVEAWTDDGPIELAIDDIAERENGPGLAFELQPWSPFRLWSSLSRVDAFHWPAAYDPWGLWGLSKAFWKAADRAPRQKGITIDAWAMTSIMHYSGRRLWPAGTPAVDAERDKLRVLEYLPAGTVHRLFPDGAESIVCIGAGGGLDLLTAKYFGAQRIDGVEINKGVVYAVRDFFYEFAGNLYNPDVHPEVAVHIAEGRHFLEQAETSYDVVQLSGVDTFSTTEAGAFSLSENYLYTVEAFGTYLEHLNPGGVLTLTRWFYPRIVEAAGPESAPPGSIEPRFSLRLLTLARRGLEEAGIADPARSIFFMHSGIFTVILVKPDGFAADELDTLHEHCERYGFGVLFSPRGATPTLTLPDGTFVNPMQQYMDTSGEARGQFVAERTFDVSAPVDDKPFFFEVSKFDQVLEGDVFFTNAIGGLTAHGTLAVMLVELLLLGLLFVILPIVRSREGSFPGSRRVRAGILLYFTAIGFGFIVVEIILSQKFVLFLGHPIYALAVILFSILLFSGIGSLLSFKFPLPRFATWLAGGLAIVPVYLFPIVFEEFLGYEQWQRVAISVGILAPIGLAMGIPFPVGLRVLGRVQPSLIPWAWAVNGYTSVLGSVLAVVLAIEFGFTTVLFVAAGTYTVGVIGYSLMAIGGARRPSAQDAA